MDDNFVSQVVTSLGFSDPSTIGYHEVVGHFHTFVDKEDPEIDAFRGFPKFLNLVKWFGDWMEGRGIFVEDLLKNDDRGDEDDEVYGAEENSRDGVADRGGIDLSPPPQRGGRGSNVYMTPSNVKGPNTPQHFRRASPAHVGGQQPSGRPSMVQNISRQREAQLGQKGPSPPVSAAPKSEWEKLLVPMTDEEILREKDLERERATERSLSVKGRNEKGMSPPLKKSVVESENRRLPSSPRRQRTPATHHSVRGAGNDVTSRKATSQELGNINGSSQEMGKPSQEMGNINGSPSQEMGDVNVSPSISESSSPKMEKPSQEMGNISESSSQEMGKPPQGMGTINGSPSQETGKMVDGGSQSQETGDIRPERIKATHNNYRGAGNDATGHWRNFLMLVVFTVAISVCCRRSCFASGQNVGRNSQNRPDKTTTKVLNGARHVNTAMGYCSVADWEQRLVTTAHHERQSGQQTRMEESPFVGLEDEAGHTQLRRHHETAYERH